MNCIFVFKRLAIYIRSKIRNHFNDSYRWILQILNNATSKEILIVGSGPAAEKLNNIQIKSDMMIFATNRSIFNLKSGNTVYLYTTTTFSLCESKETLFDRIKNYKVKNIILNKKLNTEKHDTIITYEFDDTYFLERIMSSHFLMLLIKYFKFLCKGYHLHPSQGTLLVILALFVKPKQIYTIGISSPKQIQYSKHSGYDQKKEAKINLHYFVDKMVLEKFHNKITRLDDIPKNNIKRLLTQ